MADDPDGADVLELPAADRPGKAAWLGPISVAFGLVSWLVPSLAGAIVGLVACGCGAVSILTRRDYRIDWTAVAGICLGAVQVALELVLFAMSRSGL